MWIEYQPNPCGHNVGDCSVRAISKALDVDWETAYLLLCQAGYAMCDVISSNIVSGAVLRQRGFKRANAPYTEHYTVQDFCKDNPVGVFVVYMDGHVATVVDGNLYDIWNSLNETILYVWYNSNEPIFDT